MTDLLEAFANNDSELPQTLEPARLGESPGMFLFFTTEMQEASLHFVEDPTVRAFVPCPGDLCPVCYCGSKPSRVFLLPILNVVRRAVEIMRVPPRRGPGALLTGILPHLRGEGAREKLFLISRDGSQYTVEVQALGEDADSCAGVVAGFIAAVAEGLSFLSAFSEFSAAELAQIPEVQRALDARGGWNAPEQPGGTEA